MSLIQNLSQNQDEVVISALCDALLKAINEDEVKPLLGYGGAISVTTKNKTKIKLYSLDAKFDKYILEAQLHEDGQLIQCYIQDAFYNLLYFNILTSVVNYREF